MALASTTIFQVQASATTGNTNGAGFNPANANFPTDLAATSATGTAPVVTSATYTFVAGDVGAYVYIKSGTNWTPGWYLIASVAAGAATLTASIGSVVKTIGIDGQVTLNTVAGCATVASPTGGTYGVDYSQQDTANSSVADLASVGSSTTLTSVSNPWSPVSVGNYIHITTTGTGAHFVVGWYEIVSESGLGSVVLDRTPNDGTAGVAGTGQTGGAGRLNGLESTFLNMLPGGSITFIKNGTYTASATITASSSNGTGPLPVFVIGYNSIRGDSCIGTNRPVLALGANGFAGNQFNRFQNLIITTSASAGYTMGTVFFGINCKFLNTSTAAGRIAITASSTSVLVDCEAISQNGIAYATSTGSIINAYGCYIHDSVTGISTTSATNTIVNSIIANNTTAGITLVANNASQINLIANNTIYGSEAKIGIGLNLSGAASFGTKALGNIFYGLTTGISTTGTGQNYGESNDFFNNTTDVTNWTKDASAQALNPTFAGASQLTGTTATTSGSVLTDAGANFAGVNNNIDFLHVTSGTGVTVACYLITSHTGTTLTVNNTLGTSSGGDVVYWVSNGHNFQIGTNLKGLGFPNLSNATGALTTGYPDIGAVQRQEPSSTATLAATFAG